MSTFIFVKYEGAGNDFVLIDDRAALFPLENQQLIRNLCHRQFGIGADGLILLQNDPVADFRMRIFNSDGTEAESCGNGLRCFMLFLSDLGLSQKRTKISIDGRIVEGRFEGNKISIEMKAPRDLKLGLQIEGRELHSVDTGVPHVVQFVSKIDSIHVEREGAFLRRHPFFQPRGTNVNFVERQSDGAFRVRTFERGVEGETLACGTGAAAVAVIAAQVSQAKSPVRLIFSGGEIEISFQNEDFSDLKMAGPARRVFSGIYEL